MTEIRNGYDYETAEIIDVNGSKYVVGVDQYGCLSIQSGEMDAEGRDVFHVYGKGETYNGVSLHPDAARKVAQFIEDNF